MATATDNTITGDMATTKLELDIKKITTTDETQGGIIPMSNNMVEVAINNNCIDNNGNAVCQIYKTTIKNTGSINLFVDGYITLTGGSGVPADYAPTKNNTTMRWAQVFCDENDTNCTTVGNTTTGATNIDAFTTLDNKEDKTGLNPTNIKTTYGDIVQSGTILGNNYDVINKNYIRVSDRYADSTKFNKERDITSALVYNQYLGITSPICAYYFVVWLSENGHNQTQIVNDDFFGGIITFITSSGNITGEFGNFNKAKIPTKGIATNYIKKLYNDGSEIKTVHIGGDEVNPTVSLNETQNIMLDNNGNYRYYGDSPQNYVKFNNELWRIISVGNVKKNEEDTEGETRIKIIRDQSIGNYSWDSSESSVNRGYGVNNWPTSDLNTLLNDYYYNGKDNEFCYINANKNSKKCSFSSIRLNGNSKEMINDTLWNLGSNRDTRILPHKMYEVERETTTYQCTTGEGCPRATTWVGKIGLMYPSDYGYATDLSTCSSLLYNYNDEGCASNDWLYNNSHQWSITPVSRNPYYVWFIYSSGIVHNEYYPTSNPYSIRPTLYLKPNVSIVSGEGTSQKPYELELS